MGAWKCAGSQEVPLGVLCENTGFYGAISGFWKTVSSPTMFGEISRQRQRGFILHLT